MSVINRPRRLVLIRHGESLRNKAKKGAVYFASEADREHIRGIPDHKIILTDEGILQAEKTGGALSRLFAPPDYFYTPATSAPVERWKAYSLPTEMKFAIGYKFGRTCSSGSATRGIPTT